MSIHYNAFISYRHSPVDSRVAALVQRQLEHFRVPRAIQKRTGRKKIDRLFRDKEELPITSDLNDDIAEALANSEFLIVICSPRTRESLWVQREIETFLKNHSRRQVLTVLAEGEPEDIIPEILRYDEQADPLTGQTRRTVIEPLSCDWRMSDRRARREELPRLAAALLGCGYDELRQRQRQYKMRRLTAGLSAALACSLLLAAYFVRTSIRIQENYEEALRSQSRYLASGSERELEEGRRVTALQLALAALPGEGKDRPVVPEAEFALTRAVGAYVTSNNDPEAVGAFLTDGAPVDLEVDRERGRLYVLDDRDMLTVWEIGSGSRLVTVDTGLNVVDFLDCGDKLVVWGDEYQSMNGRLRCFSAADGRELWRYEMDCGAVALTPDGSTLIVAGQDQDYFPWIWHLDPATGEISNQSPLQSVDGGDEPFVPQNQQPSFSPDGSLMSLVVYCSYTSETWEYISGYYLYLYDWREHAGSYLPQQMDAIRDSCFTVDGGVALSGRVEPAELFGGSYGVLDYVNMFRSTSELLCFDIASGELRWRSELEYYQVSDGEELLLCPGGELLCVKANVCQLMDTATGGILQRGEATSSILDVEVREDRANLITRDGSAATFTYADGACAGRPVLAEDLRAARRVRDAEGSSEYYVIESYGGQVWRYAYGVVDESWQAFDGEPLRDLFRYIVPGKNRIAIVDYDDRLYFYSGDGAKQTCVLELEDLSCQLVGFSEDESRFYLVSKATYTTPTVLFSVDPETGDYTQTLLEGQPGECYRVVTDVVYAGGRAFFGAESWQEGENAMLVAYDPGADTWESFDLGSQFSVSGGDVFVQGNTAVCSNEAGVCRRVELTGGEAGWMELELKQAQEFEERRWLVFSPQENRMAGVGDDRIWISDAAGSLLREISLDNKRVAGITFDSSGEVLCFQCTDGGLYRYSAEGELLSVTDLTRYTNAASFPDLQWCFLDNGDLVLNTDKVFNLISRDGWKVSSYAIDCLAYLPGQDWIVTYKTNGDGYEVGYFRRCTTEELVEKGRALLDGAELSAEQRSRYGIS